MDLEFILGAEPLVLLADGLALGCREKERLRIKAHFRDGKGADSGVGVPSRGFLGRVYSEMPTRQSRGNK